MVQNPRNDGACMDITTSSGKILSKPYSIVHSQVDYSVSKDEGMINDGVIESKPAGPKKLKELGEKRSTVEKLSNLKIYNELSQKKGKEVDTPLTKILRPPPLFLHRIKKKAEDDKFSKFMTMLK